MIGLLAASDTLDHVAVLIVGSSDWAFVTVLCFGSDCFKLNDGKTELLAISTPCFTERLHETHLRIGDGSVSP